MNSQRIPTFVPNRSTEVLVPKDRVEGFLSKKFLLTIVVTTFVLAGVWSAKLSYDHWRENRWIEIEQCRVDDCGKVGPEFLSSRIIGGRDARVGEFPYQVAITLFDSKTVLCGGNMINDRWILTAAHCFELEDDHRIIKSALRVSVGITKTSEVAANSIAIEDYFVHPQYDARSSKEYDIALIKTAESISKMSKQFTSPICLPFEDIDSPEAEVAIVSGWGLTQEDGQKLSDTLRTTKVNLLSDAICRSYYDFNFKSKSMVCAGDLRGGEDTCQGDSGGPLAIKNENASYVLKGVTSYGAGCGRKDTPGVYTKVSHYMMWTCRKMLNNGLN